MNEKMVFLVVMGCVIATVISVVVIVHALSSKRDKKKWNKGLCRDCLTQWERSHDYCSDHYKYQCMCGEAHRITLGHYYEPLPVPLDIVLHRALVAAAKKIDASDEKFLYWKRLINRLIYSTYDDALLRSVSLSVCDRTDRIQLQQKHVVRHLHESLVYAVPTLKVLASGMLTVSVFEDGSLTSMVVLDFKPKEQDIALRAFETGILPKNLKYRTAQADPFFEITKDSEIEDPATTNTSSEAEAQNAST